jgi:predicted transcriptional regulator
MVSELQQRGTFSIGTLILIALEQKPQTRTRIMQKLTLSYSRTNRYLEMLVKQDVICHDPITRTFDITPKGRRVLMLNRQLATYISPVNAMIRKYSRYIKDPYDNDVTENCFPEEIRYFSQNSGDTELIRSDAMH